MKALTRIALAVLLTASAATVLCAVPSSAQDAPPTSAEVPTQEIVPKPNSGREPTDAGDRGGALQLALLACVVTTVVGAGLHLRRQSQRARAAGAAAPDDRH